MPSEPASPVYSVYLLSALPPPTGGVATWTRCFLDEAQRFGLDVKLRPIGPKREKYVGSMARLVQLWRGFVAPFWHLSVGEGRHYPIVHMCVSAGLGFWRGLVLAVVCVLMERCCVLHLHSQIAACSPLSLRVASWLTRTRRVQLVSPSSFDAQKLPYLRSVSNFVPASYGAGTHWQGPSSGTTLRLVFSGWMIQRKGIFDVLPALAACPNVELDLYGRNFYPPDCERWQTQVEAMGLGTRVRYHGPQNLEAMPGILCAYDAVLMPTNDEEAFGYVAAEALLLGLPLLTTNTVGCVRHAPADAYVCLSPLTTEHLIDVFSRLAQDKNLLRQLSTAGRRYGEAHLGPQIPMESWRSVYAATT